MAALNTKSITTTGTAPTFDAVAAGGDTAEVGDRVFAVFKNTNASTRTITIAVAGNTSYGQPNPDPQYTIAATTGELWIPLLPVYADPTDNRAHFTYSADAGVTVAVVRR